MIALHSSTLGPACTAGAMVCASKTGSERGGRRRRRTAQHRGSAVHHHAAGVVLRLLGACAHESARGSRTAPGLSGASKRRRGGGEVPTTIGRVAGTALSDASRCAPRGGGEAPAISRLWRPHTHPPGVAVVASHAAPR
eukprot:scaffold979_cov382-Prasinococcus_capsulatus_cf.AAC.9